MLFTLQHNLYMLISTVITVALLIVFAKLIKQDKTKGLILKIFAVLTVIIHYSSLYLDFFSGNTVTVPASLMLPIYPCNVCMWLLLIVAFMKNKQGRLYKMLATFTFYASVLCGIFGILLNENFASNPNLADYGIFKGLLSHSTMIFGALYLLVGKFVNIRVSNTISVMFGFGIFLLNGFVINTLYMIFSLEPCNSMYLQEPPFSSMPWLNTFTIGIIAVLLVFVVTLIYERLALKKEDRWITHLQKEKNK